jgi:hypothetical protein
MLAGAPALLPLKGSFSVECGKRRSWIPLNLLYKSSRVKVDQTESSCFIAKMSKIVTEPSRVGEPQAKSRSPRAAALMNRISIEDQSYPQRNRAPQGRSAVTDP